MGTNGRLVLAGTAFSNDVQGQALPIDSSGQVNTTAGFSIISYTRTSMAATRLLTASSEKPEVVLYKSRSSGGWYLHKSLMQRDFWD